MRHLLVSLALVASLPGIALAEKLVVEVECLVFDRQLSDAENDQIQKAMKKLPRKSHGEFYSSEKLRLLKQNARQLSASRASFMVGESESSSLTAASENLETEAYIQVLNVEDRECEVQVQCKVAYRQNDGSTTASQVNTKLRLVLGRERMIGGGGTDSCNIVAAVKVREPRPDEGKLDKLSP